MRKFSDVIAETRRTAIKNPLGKNPNSSYYNADGSPCCIFGHVFDRLNLDRSELPYVEVVGEVNWPAVGVESPNDYESQWVGLVQVHADLGRAWILAVTYADAQLV